MELHPYLVTYSVIVIPGIVFMAGGSIFLNVVLREKHLAYVVIVGVGAVLSYLYSQGYNHWLYNPMLFQLWDYASLTGGPKRTWIIEHRLYVLTLSAIFIMLALFVYPRRSGPRR